MQADMEVTALADGVRVRVTTTDPRWTVRLGVVAPSGVQISSARLNEQPVALAPALLGQDEGRDTWVAPVRQGASSYELSVSWSKAAQLIDISREGKDHQ